MRFAAALAIMALLSGCSVRSTSAYQAGGDGITVCSGYGCVHRDNVALTEAELNRFAAIMGAATDAASEREAFGKVVSIQENIAQRRLRVKPDLGKAPQRGRNLRGQQDCVDESLNTLAMMRFLAARGLLRFHEPGPRYAERGLLLDGRYPHKSAWMTDNEGRRWVVDPWVKPTGGAPTIMTLERWRRERVAS